MTGPGGVATAPHLPVTLAEEAETASIITDPGGVEFSRALADLERRRHTLSESELREARRELWTRYVSATPRATTTHTASARTETRLREMTETIESRMRVTAWDMAHPEAWTPLEGHPGYKTIAASELREIILDALKDIPIGDLPGGQAVANALSGLPGAAGKDLTQMSANEISAALKNGATDALVESRLGQIYKENKFAVILGAVGGITAIRATSPEAADLIDKNLGSIRIGRFETDDRNAGIEASARYRDRRVFPDLDVDTYVRHNVGGVELRGGAGGTITLERDPRVTGSVYAGARYGDDRRFVDLSARHDTSGVTALRLHGGISSPEEGLTLHGSVGGTFGSGTAVGGGSGRLSADLMLDKKLDLGPNTEGSVGFWGGVETDADGRNTDARAGVMFRLRF